MWKGLQKAKFLPNLGFYGYTVYRTNPSYIPSCFSSMTLKDDSMTDCQNPGFIMSKIAVFKPLALSNNPPFLVLFLVKGELQLLSRKRFPHESALGEIRRQAQSLKTKSGIWQWSLAGKRMKLLVGSWWTKQDGWIGEDGQISQSETLSNP